MFKIINKNKEARLGILKTAHGDIETPFFMPVATKGTVKNISPEELETIETKAIISNAFVLYLRPGLETIEKFGGIHKFMNFKRVIFTDSGGFQMLIKGLFVKDTENGILFKNPFTNQKELINPKKAIEIENRINSDVAMALDCVPYYRKDKKYIAEAVRKTHKWAEECKKAHKNKKQLLFGITQGGTYKDLREKSAKFINKLDFDGIALGGLCIGESEKEMHNMIKCSVKHFKEDKPRYLMGVGSPKDLIKAVEWGVDIFDSRFPTKNARHGRLFSKDGYIDIMKNKYKHNESSLDCDCYFCKNFSLAYLHHLFKVDEKIALRYASLHNLRFIQRLMGDIRTGIRENDLKSVKKEYS